MERTVKSVEINVPVSVAFDLYSDFERFPEWMKHIKQVRRTGANLTKWAADAPLGIDVEWEAELTAFEPNRKIAWKTVRGDIDMQGEVTFKSTGTGTTLLQVAIGYRPPAGHLGAVVAKLFGSDPEKEIEEELGRFAKLAESRNRKNDSRRKSRGATKAKGSAKRMTA